MESILFFGVARKDNSDRLSFYDDLCKKVSGFNLNVFGMKLAEINLIIS